LNFNQFLPIEELKKVFDDDEWNSLDYVLTAFSTFLKIKKDSHVLHNPELLGEVHNAANLDKYMNKDWRKKLFKQLPPTEQQRFFTHCGITDKISEMSFDNFTNYINQVVGFEWGDNDLTRQFILFSNLPDYLIPDVSIEIKTQEVIFGGGNEQKFKPMKMLHGYQSSVVYRALQLLEEANAHCLVQMPTGTGKTRIGMEILAFLFLNNPNIRIVWLANKHELLEQAHDAFVEIWNHLGKFEIELLNMWTSTSQKISELTISKSNTLIFTTYDLLNNVLDKGKNLDADYIIVDEAHQILAPTYMKAKDRISNMYEKETRLLGLTATPGRGIDEDQNTRLVEVFHKQIVPIELYGSDKINYKSKPIQYLEDHEILSVTKPEKLHTDFEIDFTPEEWNKLKESSLKTGIGDRHELDQKSFKKMANDNERNIRIVEKLKEYVDAGKKILYFATDIKQSLFIFTVLQQMGINAVHVESGIDTSYRRQLITKFKDTKEIEVICNYGIFATGFDVPKLDVVFIARPINSPVLFNQIAGRGTRGLKMDGTKEHILLQVVDKVPPAFVDANPYEQFNFWDNIWRK
jgi:DNA repair protein RadD